MQKVSGLKLSEAIRLLESFKYIFISGPQRSGTTIATNILASELRYNVLYEGNITTALKQRFPNKINILEFIDIWEGIPIDSDPGWCRVKQYNNFVAQCPGFSSIVHKWSDIEDLAVVMMIRPTSDIIASQERIKWIFEDLEKQHYGMEESTLPIAQIKYDFWQSTQKDILGNKGVELEYSSLKGHSMWVSKKHRANFSSRQFEIGVPRGSRFQDES